MKNWIQARTPSSYWTREDTVRCRTCSCEFTARFAHGNEVVKFAEDDGGIEERWLPTFEPGGYLDLLERLVPGYTKDQRVTMPISRKFEAAFKEIQERSAAGKTFSVAVGYRCHNCGSSSVDLVKEQIIDSPLLNWLRYQSGD